jgi:hypothetical protein
MRKGKIDPDQNRTASSITPIRASAGVWARDWARVSVWVKASTSRNTCISGAQQPFENSLPSPQMACW